MFGLARRSHSRVLAAVLLALTTVLVGFAHRPMAAIGFVEREAAAWRLPDGSPVFLCHLVLADPRDRTDDGSSPVTRCEACRLMAAPGLGSVAEIVVAMPADVPIGRATVVVAAMPVPLSVAPRSRGPPSRRPRDRDARPEAA